MILTVVNTIKTLKTVTTIKTVKTIVTTGAYRMKSLRPSYFASMNGLRQPFIVHSSSF
jgi:hypothetical protein